MTVRPWTDTARKLRREMSLPEVLLWQQLRARTGGFKFRRQHAIGDYVLDFFCAAASFAVEIDGWAHSAGDRPVRDERRDAWLAERGIRVVRILATEVVADSTAVAASLTTLAASILPARGEVARSAGGRGDRAAAAPRSNPPPPSQERWSPSPLRGEDQEGIAPCR